MKHGKCWALAGLLAATTANGLGYVLMAPQGEGSYWKPGDVTLQLKLGASPVLRDGSTWSALVRSAFDDWNRHMTVLRLVGSEANGTVGAGQNGINETFFAPDVYGRSFGPYVAAVTLVTSGGYDQLNTEVDVVFNSSMRWESYRGPLQTANGQVLLDFRRVALHEFGHIIGLAHPDQYSTNAPPAVMQSSTGTIEELTADDIAGAAFLYGPGEAPKFSDQPRLNLIPSIGTGVYLTFGVSGTPPFRYELFRNGGLVSSEPVPPGWPVNRLLAYVAFNNSYNFGEYRVDLINRVGRSSSQNYVFQPDPSTAPPRIATEPLNASLALGQPGLLSVFATGKPAPKLIWYKDGQTLSNASGACVVLQGLPSSAGTYHVEALNGQGRVRSRPAIVAVSSVPYEPGEWCSLQPVQPSGFETITYGAGLFVTHGNTGLLTSTDGFQWTERNLRIPSSIIYAQGRFVAVGSSATTNGPAVGLVSVDGLNWARVEVEGASKAVITGLAFGNDLFVAVDLYGRAIVSANGLEWRASPWQAPAGQFIDAVVFGNGLFVASSRTNRIWTSLDGMTWTERDSGVATGMNALAFGNGVFVGVGRLEEGLSDKSVVGVSADGVTWTSRVIQSVRDRPQLRFINGRFHLTAGCNHLISADGREWEQRDFTGSSLRGIAFVGGRYVAATANKELFQSDDGLTWTPGELRGSSAESVFFVNGRFLSDTGLFSEDGIAWQSARLSDLDVRSIAYGSGSWVCVGRSIGRSTDGRAWSLVLRAPQAAYNAMAFAAGRFTAVGYDSREQQGFIAQSTDGTVWTESRQTGVPELRGVTHGAHGLVAVGNKGTILHSADGTSWVSRHAGTTKDLHNIVWDGSRYIAVGGDGYGAVRVVEPGAAEIPNATVCTSMDGVDWHVKALPYDSILCTVAELDGLILAGANDGRAFYSRDGGSSWQQAPSAPGILWRIAAGKSYFIGAGAGQIMRITPAAVVSKARARHPPLVYSSGSSSIVSLYLKYPEPTSVTWRRAGAVVGQSSGTVWKTETSTLLPDVYFADSPEDPTPQPVVLVPSSSENVSGNIALIRAGIRHTNGNLYDQYLLTGDSAQLRARPGIIARVSFRDLNEDIVQVEFSGSGMLTLRLEEDSAPAKAPHYNQDIDYVKGHARIFISDADETTNISVFSVGSLTAVDQSLFKVGVAYDGIADIGLLAIHSRNGRFGGVRLGNASIWNRTDVTGFWAPDTKFLGPIVLGDISGFDGATSGLVVRQADSVTIAGGDLTQANGRTVSVDGTPVLKFSAGTDSHNRELPAKNNRAHFTQDGQDVTARMVPPQ